MSYCSVHQGKTNFNTLEKDKSRIMNYFIKYKQILSNLNKVKSNLDEKGNLSIRERQHMERNCIRSKARKRRHKGEKKDKVSRGCLLIW